MSLLELIAALSLTVVTFLLAAQGGVLALRWHETEQAIVGADTTAERVRRALVEACGRGVPIDALSITAKGEIVEETRPDATHAWSWPAAATFRTGSGYEAITPRGRKLVRWRIARDGRVEVAEIAPVNEARFGRLGERRGIEYELALPGGRTCSGAVALRVDVTPETALQAPRAATRWGGGK
jgi:hypothetical protein